MIGTNNAERIRIGETGNIGIGTTTAGYPLTVQGDSNHTGAFRFNGDAGTAGYVLQSTGSAAPVWVATSSLGISSGGASQWTTSGSNIYFTTGNVGIGSSTPAYPLTVNGSGYFGGNVTATGAFISLSAATSTFSGNIAITGSIIPSADDTYDLGSPTMKFRNLYLGAHSLYIDGQEVLQSQSNKIVVSADITRPWRCRHREPETWKSTRRERDRSLLKGNIRVTSGESFTTSLGGPVNFTSGTAAGNLSLTGNTINATNLNGGITLAATGTGGIYFTQGNVGIGTTSPNVALSVVGAAAITGNASVGGNVTAAAFYGDGSNLTGITSFSTTTTRNLFSNTATGLSYSTTTGVTSLASGYVIPLAASTTEWSAKISSQWTSAGSNISYTAGNVGIGSTAGNYRLEVQGTTTGPAFAIRDASGVVQGGIGYDGLGLSLNSPNGSSVMSFQNGYIRPAAPFLPTGGTLAFVAREDASVGVTVSQSGIAGPPVNPLFRVQSSSGMTGDLFQVYKDATQLFTVGASGNVGIGTTTPGSLLSVAGDMNFTGALRIMAMLAFRDTCFKARVPACSGSPRHPWDLAEGLVSGPLLDLISTTAPETLA